MIFIVYSELMLIFHKEKKKRKSEQMAKDSQLDQELQSRLEDQPSLVDPEINMEEHRRY